MWWWRRVRNHSYWSPGAQPHQEGPSYYVPDLALRRQKDEQGLSLYHVGPPMRRGLHLGYAGVPEREITTGVERLARALERWRRAGGGGVRPVLRSGAR